MFLNILHLIIFIYYSLFLNSLGMGLLLADEQSDDVSNNFTRQLIVYPQEKIYLQTDKTHYLSGETIWFAATVVDAVLHTPVIDDRYLYVEFRTPLDSVVSRHVVLPDSLHGFYGHVPLEKDLAEGRYNLVAYRSTSTDPDYFFKRTVFVSDPVSAVIVPEYKWSENERDYLVDLSFVDPQTNEKLIPDRIAVQVNGGQVNGVKLQEDMIGRFSFRKSVGRSPVLTLHIDYQKKQYKKYVPVSVQGGDYDVMFFPEGGNLIAGEPAVVAFKAINRYGLSEPVTGYIADGEGNVIQEFETVHKGMGKFIFQPEKGKTYFAVCKDKFMKEKRFNLPEAQTGNYSIRVMRQQKWVSISIVGINQSQGEPQLSLFIHTKGLPLYHAQWNVERNLLLIEQDSLPSGISHILLLNAHNDILSERLVFNRNRADEAVIHYATDADIYDRRTRVSSTVSLTDCQGAPLSGKFAVSITDDQYVTPDSAIHILSALLLASELKGHIESPANYFREESPETTAALDLLMLTQGWRRYDVPEVIQGRIAIPETAGRYDRDITGKVERRFRAVKDAPVSLIATTPAGSELKITATDKNGRFIFDDLIYPDSSHIIIQATDKKDKGDIYLTVKQPELTNYKITTPSIFSTENANRSVFHEYTVVADRQFVNEYGIRTRELPEVTVTAKKYIPKSVFYSPINVFEVITAEDIEKMPKYSTFESFLKNAFIGVNTKRGSDEKGDAVLVRNAGEEKSANIIINDRIESFFQFESIGLSMFESIFILKNDYFNGGGLSGRSDVSLVITLKKEGWGGKSRSPENIRKIEWPGYRQPVAFYAPKYETVEEKNSLREDLRTTLYWNPHLQTNGNGEAYFDFYTADATTTAYSAIIEGITDDGKIIRHVKKIFVK